MPETAQDEMYEQGTGRLLSRAARTISDTEIERRDARGVLRQRLTVLRAWSNDAQDVAALTAMTATQRLARQAVIETRVAALAKICQILAWQLGEDDGN